MQLREQYDADRFGGGEDAHRHFRPADNAFPAICEMCGRTWYVSHDWSDAINAQWKKVLKTLSSAITARRNTRKWPRPRRLEAA